MEQLIHFDQQLFHYINYGMSNQFFDWLMPLLRNRFLWLPLYLFLIVFFLSNYKKTGLVLIIFLFLTFALTDSFASALIKPAIGRLRPCNDPDLKTVIVSRIACGSGYSFPSSHASNHFGIAMFLTLLFYRKWKWILPVSFTWAFLIVFAQVYVGVHFPLDVFCGALLGCMLAYITATIFEALTPKW